MRNAIPANPPFRSDHVGRLLPRGIAGAAGTSGRPALRQGAAVVRFARPATFHVLNINIKRTFDARNADYSDARR